MNPPQDYDGASQSVLANEYPESPSAADEVLVLADPLPEDASLSLDEKGVPSVLLYDLQSYAEDNFFISFKSNERNVKSPNQVVSDDILYCMPNKPICVYLGDRIPPIDGFPLPRVLVYLKYSADRYKNKKVETCDNHRKSGLCVLESDNVDVILDNNGAAHILNFAYPQANPNEADDVPSISFSFVCSSSCFSRSIFALHVEFFIPDTLVNGSHIFVPRRHLVKVTANPGRDSGQQKSILPDLTRFKTAFIVSKQKPRARKPTGESENEPCVKRRGSVVQQVQNEGNAIDQLEALKTDNNVYTLHILGMKDFQQLASQYNLMLIRDKYKLQGVRRTGINNSQIPPTAELDAWLDDVRMKKHKGCLNENNIRTLDDLHKAYYARLFEDLGIPGDDAASLHCSFIYWRTNHIAKIIEESKNGSQ
uniref:P53 DNA-binding domain-containing protein n=1 Tax=Panagrolaimus davidi TaxID=227884 RepID=A0A914P2Z7_9BILA